MTNVPRLPKTGFFLRVFILSVQMGRRLVLRYLYFPRPETKAHLVLEENANLDTGIYNFRHGYIEPWYMKASHPEQSDPGKYRAEGYNLDKFGPVLQEGKGMDEMAATVEFLKSYDRSGCPFSHGGKETCCESRDTITRGNAQLGCTLRAIRPNTNL